MFFLEAMSGKMSRTIFTDQDASVSRALSLAKSETYHRFCEWHLVQNAVKHVGHYMRADSGFKSELKAFWKQWEEVGDFLKAWDAFLDKYDVRDDAWLQSMFEVTEKWAKANVRTKFSAGMNG